MVSHRHPSPAPQSPANTNLLIVGIPLHFSEYYISGIIQYMASGDGLFNSMDLGRLHILLWPDSLPLLLLSNTFHCMNIQHHLFVL